MALKNGEWPNRAIGALSFLSSIFHNVYTCALDVRRLHSTKKVRACGKYAKSRPIYRKIVNIGCEKWRVFHCAREKTAGLNALALINGVAFEIFSIRKTLTSLVRNCKIFRIYIDTGVKMLAKFRRDILSFRINITHIYTLFYNT